MLFAEHQRRNSQSEDRRGGVDHLREGQLHIVEPDVSEGDAGAEGEAQQEHFALGTGGQVLLCHALVSNKPVIHDSYDYGREHVQSRQEERVSEVVHHEDPFVQAGDGGSRDQPHHHGQQEVQVFRRTRPPLPGVPGLLAFGGAIIGVDHVRVIFSSAGANAY